MATAPIIAIIQDTHKFAESLREVERRYPDFPIERVLDYYWFSDTIVKRIPLNGGKPMAKIL